jgi:hypothetical protein
VKLFFIYVHISAAMLAEGKQLFTAINVRVQVKFEVSTVMTATILDIV